MHFISLPFFLFFFILLVVYYTVPKQTQNMVLLSASLLFYGWADVRFLLYILFTGFSIFASAIFLGRMNEAKKELSKCGLKSQPHTGDSLNTQADSKLQRELKRINKSRKCVFLLTLLLNLGILAATKYSNFVIDNVNRMTGSQLSFLNLLIPMGISFYTFQAVAYLVDVYRGEILHEKSLVRFVLFTSFFPQLIQGPISRYAELSKTLYAPHFFSCRQLFRGMERMLWGLFKKMVIADRLRPFVDSVFVEGNTASGTTIFIGMVFFVLMLYADFSGGIDMTIGISESLGILVSDNFKQPFFSRSLKEYWRRWHITMGSWFRDYVFYPVSMSAGMRRLILWNKRHLGKKAARRLPVYFATVITWFATGLWHGAGWNYVCWGLANALILMLSEELEPLYAKMRKVLKTERSHLFRVFQSARTLLLICVLNLFDCAGSLTAAGAALVSIFFAQNLSVLTDGSLLMRGMGAGDFVVVGAALVLLFLVDLYSYRASKYESMPDLRSRIHKLPSMVVVLIFYVLFLIIIVFGVYGPGYVQTQFIYNRF